MWGPTYAGESDYLKVHVQRIHSGFGTVAPGFDHHDFELGHRIELLETYPANDFGHLIVELTR